MPFQKKMPGVYKVDDSDTSDMDKFNDLSAIKKDTAMASFFFRLIRVIIVLGISLGLAFWLFASRQRPEKQKVVHSAAGVRVIPAVSGPRTMRVEAFGTVIPRKKVNLAAEIGGRIDYIHPGLREGAAIGPEDLLIRIDQRSFILDRNAARAGVDQVNADISRLTREIANFKADVELAKKNVALTRKEWDRVRTLGENQFASKTNVDKAEQQYLSARIQLQAAENRLALTPPMMAQLKAALALAKNNLAKARLALEKSEIRSGFHGYVLTRQAEVGEFVNPGQTLGILYEKGELDVDVRIPLEELAWMKPLFDKGQQPKVQVSIANLGGGETWNARVARIKANIDEKTRTLPITVEIGEEGGQTQTVSDTDPLMVLKPGTFVRCEILGQTHENIFEIPRYLLHQENRLYLVRDKKLVIQRVTVLRKYEDNVFIAGGLSDGDKIVSSPLPAAVDGMALSVKAEGEAP